MEGLTVGGCASGVQLGGKELKGGELVGERVGRPVGAVRSGLELLEEVAGKARRLAGCFGEMQAKERGGDGSGFLRSRRFGVWWLAML